MPWRDHPTPYRVWISEVMLQQTQVETVIPYFERFLERFPDVDALARSNLQDVLKAWEGLGYYARARNLHRAARVVRSEYAGALPGTFDALLALPGFGPYTAAAVASIAFGESVPVVDGNVLRVFTRFFGIVEDTRKPRARRLVFDRLAPFVPRRTRPFSGAAVPPGSSGAVADARHAPGDFNQAMMELGALVCRPRPRCPECPLRTECVAHVEDRTAELPVRSARPTRPHHEIAVGVVRHEGKILIGRRRPEQMLGGLWEFPGGKRESGEPLRETARREIFEETGLEVSVGERIAVVNHAYTHFSITMTAFDCRPREDTRSLRPTARSAEELRWVAPEELDAYPFPRASLVVISHLERPRPERERPA